MILIVNMNSRGIAKEEFIQPLVSLAKENFTKHYKEIKKEYIERAEKIILSGTPIQDNKFLKDLNKFEWIKNCDKPTLGICAGMQVISLIFGSSLEENQEIGMTNIKTTKENTLFSGNFKAYEIHNYSAKLPEGFDLIAKSENCMQAMKHKEKEIYGVLFHPEVRNTEIIKNFVGMN